MKLRKKIIIGFISLASLLVLMMGFIFYSLNQQQQARAEEDRIVRIIENALLLDIDALRIMVLLEQYSNTHKPEILQEIEYDRVQSRERRTELRMTTRLSSVIAELDKYDALLASRRLAADKIVLAVNNKVPSEDLQAIRQERAELDNQAREHLSKIVEIERAALDDAIETAQAADRQFTSDLVVALGVYLVVFTAIAASLGRQLSGSLLELTNMAKAVGSGNLDVRNSINRTDEIGALAVALNSMAEELGKLDQAKDDFISIGTHQLRTPATAVKQYLELLRDESYAEPLKPTQKKFANEAYVSNERQLETINDLLNVAQVTAGTLTLHKKRTDVSHLLECIVNDCQPTAATRNQELVFDCLQKPVYAYVDQQRLRMVVENIVDNASKYTPENGKIVVRLTKEDDSLQISIKDTGVGIAKEHIPKLFSRFSRVPNQLSHLGGTGLGLYLARKLVELHGGSISVDSVVGEGTEFRIVIPVR